MNDREQTPTVNIPTDPEERARLAKFAGLTDEERHAIEVWCFEEQRKRAQGVLLHDGERNSKP